MGKFHYNPNILRILPGLLLAALMAFGIDSSANASNDAFESGRDHGCDDARISDPSNRYINQPEKGPSFHTGEFMDGYNAGFSECSGSVDNFSSDNDNDDTDDSSSSGQTENRGIIGNFADGRQDGIADGASDYRSGQPEFARCPGGSLDYCAGYDLGYHDGYESARKVG